MQHVDKVLGKSSCLPSLMLHGLFVVVHLFPIMNTSSLPHLNKSLVASTNVITFCLAMKVNKFLNFRNKGFKYMPGNVKSPLLCLFFKGKPRISTFYPLQLFIFRIWLSLYYFACFLNVSITKELNMSSIEEDYIKPAEKNQRSFLWDTCFCRRFTRLRV